MTMLTAELDAGTEVVRVVADSIRNLIPGGAFVGGDITQVTSPLGVHEVETGQLIGTVDNVSSAGVASAVECARRSLDSPWEPWQRQEALLGAASELEALSDDAALILAAEGIKTITEARQEVQRAVHTLKLSARAIDTHTGETLNLSSTARGSRRSGYFERCPLGVVGAITPFNDPLNLVAHKIGPALAAGNAVIVKPAEQTPFSALLLAVILHGAGVPAGRLAVLPGDSATGRALVELDGVDVLTFTGGERVGNSISAQANGRKVLLELGGNNAVVVAPDANLDAAVTACVAGAFSAAGQNCISVQRVYVHESIIDAVLPLALRQTERLRVGTKFDPGTEVGPMVSDAAVRSFLERIAEAERQGAEVRTGGVARGRFVDPTILTSVDETTAVFQEECFAPVMSIVAYDDWRTLPDRIHSGGQPMQVGVFSADIGLCLSLADRLRAGTVLINESSDFRIDSMPFGSFGRSGVGREGVKFAMQELSAPKSIIFSPIDSHTGTRTEQTHE